MSYLLDSALDAERLADCRAGDAQRQAAERALFATVTEAIQRRLLQHAAGAIDREFCCDTTPGDLDAAEVLQESHWGLGFFIFGSIGSIVAAGLIAWLR